MDPQATLRAISEYLDTGDIGAARDLLRAYYRWRERGGFEPRGGDRQAQRLLEHAYA